MDEGLIRRIERESGVPNLADVLAGLRPTDLQSLLLEVQRRRVATLSPGAVLRRYEENRFVRPASVDPASLVELDGLAFSVLPPGYERIELAPVCPLGSVAALTPLDQNWVVSTVRNTEVLSDSTNVLALECACRRRAGRGSSDPIRLCSSHRLVRAQPIENPSWRPHFRLFALCAAGRDRGHSRFETEHLVEHVGFYLRFMTRAADSGLELGTIRVLLTDLDDGGRISLLEERVLAPLAAGFPDAELGFNQDRAHGRGYYAGICFEIRAGRTDGSEASLVDGGLTDWTQRLLGDRKERLLISGIGTELLVGLFSPQA